MISSTETANNTYKVLLAVIDCFTVDFIGIL